MGWSVRDIPSQAGRRAVVTGGTGGLGFATALALAGAGADVVLSGRNDAKARDALARLRRAHPDATVRYEPMDLASLASVAAFAQRLVAEGRPLDILVDNAGVMAVPRRELTEDGFERQFGTNHLGHFALVAGLLPLLRQAASPRVVAVSSLAASRGARIDFADLRADRGYSPWTAYRQSKLANLLFAMELQRRSAAGGWGLTCLAAHPGWSRTDLFGTPTGLQSWVFALALPLFSQSAAEGALPQLYAATDPGARPSSFTGPDGAFELKGAPAPAKIPPLGHDAALAARLWDVSAQLTGAVYPA